MSRSPSCTCTAVLVCLLGSGCNLGPLASHRATSPVVPRSLTDAEIEALWGDLVGENPGLLDQSAGDVKGKEMGWGWCPHCGNVKLPHKCPYGGGTDVGGPRKYSTKQWAVAISVFAALLLVSMQ